MKFLFVILLLANFAGIAVFGIFGMHAGMQNHNDGCIAATAQGVDCPKQANPLDYLAFHLNAFGSFSTATFSDFAASFLILSLFVIGIVFGVLPRYSAPPEPAYARITHRNSFGAPLQRGFIRWLAFHENSPATL